MLFNIPLELNGSTIKQLAANKLGKLLAKKERNLDQITVSIDRSILNVYEKTNIKDRLLKENSLIDKQVVLLEVMIAHMKDSISYSITIRELEFLSNMDALEY